MEIKMVDAIEDGKIVKVTEEYAKREGLMILRKEDPSNKYVINQKPRRKEEEMKAGMEELRKPLHWKKKQVVAELVDNFHWAVANERKIKNLTRKQVAKDLEISENDLKMIENGVLPYEDFVIVNKIQKYYGINLRRDGQNFDKSMRGMLNETKVEAKIGEDKEDKEKQDRKEEAGSDDIEIIE